jgi:diguanylate cyclase (GGDEF)-like protein
MDPGVSRFAAPLEAQFRAARMAALAEYNVRNSWVVAALVMGFSVWDAFVDPQGWRTAFCLRGVGAAVILGCGLAQRLSRRVDWASILVKLRFTAAVVAVSGALAALEQGYLVGIAGLMSIVISTPYISIDRRDLVVMNAIPIPAIAAIMWMADLDRFAFVNSWVFLALALAASYMLARVFESANRRAFALEQQLKWEARTDALSGLSNRRALDESAAREIKRASRAGSALAVIVADVDHFKAINDRHGHSLGDEVIRSVARTLHATARESDTLGRWGGEEFLAILPDSDETAALAMAERMRAAIEFSEQPVPAGERVTISLGVAALLPDGDDAHSWDSLVQCADRAMYEAKRGGRNRVIVGKPVSTSPRAGAWSGIRSTAPAKASRNGERP